MITLRKLRTLPPATRLRKIVRLLDGFVHFRHVPDMQYIAGLAELVRDTLPAAVPSAETFARSQAVRTESDLLRQVDTLRYELRQHVEMPVADWDLAPPAGFGSRQAINGFVTGEGSDRSGPVISIFLESIRSPFNAGSMIRTAAALGVRRVCLSPDCPSVDHPRLLRSSRGAEQVVEIHRAALDELSASWEPMIALEVGGSPVNTFAFPEHGTLLVGSEELGLSSNALRRALGRVSVPMTGPKASLNVGVACGIALHAWVAKALVSDSGDKLTQ